MAAEAIKAVNMWKIYRLHSVVMRMYRSTDVTVMFLMNLKLDFATRVQQRTALI